MKSPFKRRFRNAFVGVVLLLLLLDLIRFSSTFFIVPGVEYHNEPVDLVAELTGGLGRFREAFGFWQVNKGSVLFISGVDEGTSLESIFKANGVEAAPEQYAQRINVDRISKSTQENARRIKQTAEFLGSKSILVVTSSYHMRRSMIKIEREMARAPALNVKIYHSSVESPNFDRNLWWRSLTGWQILLSEYAKSRADDLFGL